MSTIDPAERRAGDRGRCPLLRQLLGLPFTQAQANIVGIKIKGRADVLKGKGPDCIGRGEPFFDLFKESVLSRSFPYEAFVKSGKGLFHDCQHKALFRLSGRLGFYPLKELA